MLLVTELRRKLLKNRPFPPAWENLLESVSLYRRLPATDRRELKGLILVFLAEKNFEGCGGFVINDEARLIVASQACILLLHRDSDFFPQLSSILIYPDEYLAPFREVDENGVVTEWSDRLSGESSQLGYIVISWQDVQMQKLEQREPYNVVLHEFAHELDAEDGLTGGEQGETSRRDLFDRLRRGHLRLKRDAAHGRATVLDPYGEESLAEFFAVAVESFFERPTALSDWDKELYAALARYFRQDPAQWETDGRR